MIPGYTGGFPEYTGGCSVHQESIISTSGACNDEYGGYPKYTVGCSVHRWDTMGTPETYHNECGGDRECTGRCSTQRFPYKFNGFMNDLPHINHGIPLVYS